METSSTTFRPRYAFESSCVSNFVIFLFSSEAAGRRSLRNPVHQQLIIAGEVGQFVASRIAFQAIDEHRAAAAENDLVIAHEVLCVFAGPGARAARRGLLQFH